MVDGGGTGDPGTLIDAEVPAFTLRSGSTWRDPFPMYASLRDRDPVHHVERGDFWVLTRFAETQQLYAVQNARGETLERIADLLMEYCRAQGWEDETPNRQREECVVRHIGEYALFMSGLFRERLRARGELNYYLDHGSTAYARCADFTWQPSQKKIFARLYCSFAPICDVLDKVRREQWPLNFSTVDADTCIAALWRA